LDWERQDIQKSLTTLAQDNEFYEVVDLSNNLLWDSDLEFIKVFIDSHKVQILSLTGNRFHCNHGENVDEYISQFISIIERVEKYVIIYDNPIATIDSKERLFAKLNEEHAQKLIWIPRMYVLGKGWHNIVLPHLIELTRDSHERYYWNI
jgi:hypothetical protein